MQLNFLLYHNPISNSSVSLRACCILVWYKQAVENASFWLNVEWEENCVKMKLLSRHKNIKLHNEWWCFPSSHTHSHLLSYDCNAIKNRRKIRIELSLLILLFPYKETFIFPGVHTHTQTMKGMQWRILRKGINDDDATVDDKKWNIESAESSHASTLFELKFFCETCMSQCLTSCSMREHFKERVS